MGARGPVKKPTNLRAFPSFGKRARALAAEVTVPVAIPATPESLKGVALKTWNHYCPRLFAAGLLADEDGALLELFCRAVADFDWAFRDVEKNGYVFVSDGGFERKRPAVEIMREAGAVMLRVGAHFGLSPSSRAGLKPGKLPTKREDDFPL